MAVPRHPGRCAGDDLPVDHASSPASPGRSRCARARSPPSAPSPCSSWCSGTTCRCWWRPSSARSSPPSSAPCCRCPSGKLGGVWTAIATLAFAYFFDAGDGEAPVRRRRGGLAAAGHQGAPTGHRTLRTSATTRPSSCSRVVVFAHRRRSRSSSSAAAPSAVCCVALRGSEVGAAVDRHLARPGPARGLRHLGVHRRPRRRAAGHAQQEQRQLRHELLARSSRCSGWCSW